MNETAQAATVESRSFPLVAVLEVMTTYSLTEDVSASADVIEYLYNGRDLDISELVQAVCFAQKHLKEHYPWLGELGDPRMSGLTPMDWVNKQIADHGSQIDVPKMRQQPELKKAALSELLGVLEGLGVEVNTVRIGVLEGLGIEFSIQKESGPLH